MARPACRKETVAWAAENESRWFTTEHDGGNHRILLNSSLGLWFDSHSSTADALVVECSFLPAEDWCICHALSLWFFGKLKLRGTTIDRTEQTYRIELRFFPSEGPAKTHSLFGDALAAVFFRSFVKAIDGPTATILWGGSSRSSLDSRQRF